MDTEHYERIAKQVNAAIGSGLTADDVRLIAESKYPDGPGSNLDYAAYWLARHLLNDE